MIHDKTRALITRPQGKKIVMLVCDGLGGLPHPETGKSELETAKLPQLDALAGRSSVGRMLVVEPGVTPGSGPAHLSLFGYHPYDIDFGRGALEALGSAFDLRTADLAARANYATVDADGIVQDRRAGRPSDEENRRLCEKLSRGLEGAFPGIELHILPGKEHRFTVVFRGEGLASDLNDNDPQREGRPLLKIEAQSPAAGRSAELVESFLARAKKVLADEQVATGMLLRGFSGLPDVMPFEERYGLRAGAIAAYPMYRGVAKMVGMEVLGEPKDFEGEIALLEELFDDYDFFYVHYKGTDSAGHSGLFDEKVKHLEIVDTFLPRIEALGPEALIVTGDHSTPCIHKEHSWHPVPTLIHSPLSLSSGVDGFDERRAMVGDLGVFHATELMPLALAHASRFDKFGA